MGPVEDLISSDCSQSVFMWSFVNSWVCFWPMSKKMLPAYTTVFLLIDFTNSIDLN